MNLIEAVTLADVIYLDEIDFSQQVNSPIDLGLPTGPIVIRGRCVPKTPGQLRFKLNSVRDLNVQEPFDFDIEFVGTPSPTGEPVVQWSVDHQYDQYYSVPGEPADFHIWDVKGSVTTTLASITPPRDGQACDGAERVFPVIVAMAAGQNELIVRGDAVTEGLHDHLFDVTLTDTDISVTGSAGFAPRRVNVFIRPENGACGSGGTIPGGHVRFWAAVAY